MYTFSSTTIYLPWGISYLFLLYHSYIRTQNYKCLIFGTHINCWFLFILKNFLPSFKIVSNQTDVVVWKCSVKKMILEISQNSQENTCVRVSFWIKLQGRPATSFTEHLQWLPLNQRYKNGSFISILHEIIFYFLLDKPVSFKFLIKLIIIVIMIMIITVTTTTTTTTTTIIIIIITIKTLVRYIRKNPKCTKSTLLVLPNRKVSFSFSKPHFCKQWLKL